MSGLGTSYICWESYQGFALFERSDPNNESHATLSSSGVIYRGANIGRDLWVIHR